MKVKTINVSLPAKLLKVIDQKAKKEYKSRRELFKEASLMYIQTKDNWQMLQSDIVQKAKKMELKKENQVEEMVDSLRK